ncbi:TetR/AcrR family transcriptional regulator [Bifidobacterium sp. 82T24]|uniref:TetR/AcrR family transcriptional regulator n=1 Tax=Bifidobacterium pluvialisilvae TaxID=2834436 RepID=UPI001C56FA03|nr:TetR/AcrR family transcriptional regulator [Bifidobacterium pluvialisilvae]MBW3087325.1 TetR/AcrR family transcriptional regulator [Bifidobacterium pluvialisilvae]
MVQRRNTRTEASLKQAFITLTRAKGFDATTVSDLAREARINRGTFYTHYTDKFDLRQQLIANAVGDLTDIILKSRRQPGREFIPYEAILGGLRYIKQDFDFFDAISRSGSDMELYTKTKDLIADLLVIETEKSGIRLESDGIPVMYGKEMMASALTSAIWLWLRRGCDEPPEEMALLIERAKKIAVIRPLRQALLHASTPQPGRTPR